VDREDLAVAFGKNLWRQRRVEAKLSQTALGARVQVHRVEIGELERGVRLPRLDTILKLSAGVDVPPRVLLAGLYWRPGRYIEGDFYVEDRSLKPSKRVAA
jgi:transcriptional regulator with XRE-family HTH domain